MIPSRVFPILAVMALAVGCQKAAPPTQPADPPGQSEGPRKKSRPPVKDPDPPVPVKVDRFKMDPDLAPFVEKSNIPKDVVLAWVEAGAAVTWYGWHVRHRDFRTDRDPTQLTDPIPTFHPVLNRIASKIGDLPTPPVPFAIIAGTLTTDYQLQGIGKHPALTALDLKDTQITAETLEGIGDLKGLKILNLSQTKVKDADMKHVGKLTSLTTLDLWATKISDAGFAHLKGLTNLTWLDARVGRLERPGPIVAGFTKLRLLRIGRPGANAETARAIGTNLKDLRELHFMYDRDRPEEGLLAGFKDMKSLERFVLDADVRVKDVEYFRGMDRLKSLEFPAVHLEGQTLAALKAALPNCKIVGP